MCYNVKANVESQLKRAVKAGYYKDAEEIKTSLSEFGVRNYNHTSGFSHPTLMIYTAKDAPPVPAIWGLVPHWVKDNEQRMKIWNQTLNARGDSIFDKPSFRDAAKSHRCVLYVDGFFEFHYFKNKAYPFYIHRKDGEPIPIAGLWSEWYDRENKEKLRTFTIITTDGNELLTKIHNNPKLSDSSRMPALLTEEKAEAWISPDKDEQELTQLLIPFPDEMLEAHPVKKIIGKGVVENDPEADKEVDYPELKMDKGLTIND